MSRPGTQYQYRQHQQVCQGLVTQTGDIAAAGQVLAQPVPRQWEASSRDCPSGSLMLVYGPTVLARVMQTSQFAAEACTPWTLLALAFLH